MALVLGDVNDCMTIGRVVCVDDEPSFATLTATHLERNADVDAVGFTEPAAALEDLETASCVVSDYDMPGMDGLSFLERVREMHPDLPFVLFTGKGSEEVASDAISKGVTEYLQKSTAASQYDLLANRVVNAIERYRAEQSVTRQRALVDRVVEWTPLALVVHDSEGDVVVANRRARELLAVPEASLHLRAYDASDWRLYSADGELLDADALPVARVLKRGERVRAERYRIEVADTTHEVVLNAEPLEAPDATQAEASVAYAIVGFDTPESFPG